MQISRVGIVVMIAPKPDICNHSSRIVAYSVKPPACGRPECCTRIQHEFIQAHVGSLSNRASTCSRRGHGVDLWFVRVLPETMIDSRASWRITVDYQVTKQLPLAITNTSCSSKLLLLLSRYLYWNYLTAHDCASRSSATISLVNAGMMFFPCIDWTELSKNSCPIEKSEKNEMSLFGLGTGCVGQSKLRRSRYIFWNVGICMYAWGVAPTWLR